MLTDNCATTNHAEARAVRNVKHAVNHRADLGMLPAKTLSQFRCQTSQWVHEKVIESRETVQALSAVRSSEVSTFKTCTETFTGIDATAGLAVKVEMAKLVEAWAVAKACKAVTSPLIETQRAFGLPVWIRKTDGKNISLNSVAFSILLLPTLLLSTPKREVACQTISCLAACTAKSLWSYGPRWARGRDFVPSYVVT